MEKLAAKVDEDELASFFGNQNELITSIFADSHKIMFDEGGRVMLPTDLIEHAGISTEVLFVGIGKAFQIWDPLQFKLFRDAKKSSWDLRVRHREKIKNISTDYNLFYISDRIFLYKKYRLYTWI